ACGTRGALYTRFLRGGTLPAPILSAGRRASPPTARGRSSGRREPETSYPLLLRYGTAALGNRSPTGTSLLAAGGRGVRGAEAGGGRHAGRRHRPRVQQPADGDYRLRRAAAPAGGAGQHRAALRRRDPRRGG